MGTEGIKMHVKRTPATTPESLSIRLRIERTDSGKGVTVQCRFSLP